jgi:glutamate--cysteine ligase
VLEVARELVALSRQGLKRQAVRNGAGEDESIYLEPLARIAERGTSPAAHLLETWNGSMARVVEATKY